LFVSALLFILSLYSLINLEYARFHPSDSKLLACAVDVDGHLGFWDIKQENEEGDPIVYTYKPHTRTITDIHFNPTDDTKLMTSSYDGLIRTFDMNKAEFENLALDSSSWPITSFDLSQDGHSVSLFFY
jgi:WD40 repeat protein